MRARTSSQSGTPSGSGASGIGSWCEIPDDPLLHAAVLVYASDRTLVSTIGRPHGLTWGRRVAASLDHALWLHRTPRFDDWILYVTRSPAAHAARGVVFGAMYARDGTRVASVAQEGLVRVPRRR
jgi:acyl-CoA thioesterase-2